MQGKYYSTKVRPNIPPSSQHVGVYTVKDVLFGWTAVQIPRGSARLISATAIVRGKGDANGTANPFAMDLWFADDDRNALATSSAVTNAAIAGIPSRDILGNVSLEVAGYTELGDNNTMQCVTSRHTSSDVGDYGEPVDFQFGSSIDNLVITPKMTLDVNASPTVTGYTTFYMGGIAQGAFDWSTINLINDDDIAATSPGTTLVMDGASMDIREHFTAGDTLHAADDAVIGTVDSITNSTTLELEDSIATSVLAANDPVYNINPVEIVLAFEY